MKIAGICILIFTFCAIAREQCERRKKRGELLCELSRFVSFLRLQIGCYLRPVRELVESFVSPCEELTSMIKRIVGGESLSAAFADSFTERMLGKEGYSQLESLFSSLGSGYLENELRLIDSHASALEDLLAAEKVEGQRGVKLVRTLCVAASVGALILFI